MNTTKQKTIHREPNNAAPITNDSIKRYLDLLNNSIEEAVYTIGSPPMVDSGFILEDEKIRQLMKDMGNGKGKIKENDNDLQIPESHDKNPMHGRLDKLKSLFPLKEIDLD